ncbi:hypothetical protein KAW65_09105 [candidate division WOR-3 bacterium]|nr:hypothetical protein [candidate division WOR-3 bacterium]
MYKRNFVVSLVVSFFILSIFGCGTRREVREEVGITLEPAEEYVAEHIGPKKKVAVIDFVDKTKYGKARLGTAASDILLTELGKSERFILVEREKLNKIFEEQEFELSGKVDPAQIAQAGKLLGINAIITGSVSSFGVRTEGSNFIFYSWKKQTAEATVDIRAIDVETGEIVYIETGSGAAEVNHSAVLGIGTTGGYDETLGQKALRAAIVKFTRNLIYQIDKKTTWYCRVAEVDKDNVYLDAGKESQLDIGTILEVRRPGKEIKSPETGRDIGRVETTIGKIKVISYFGEDGSIANVLSGEPPMSGDYVKIE